MLHTHGAELFRPLAEPTVPDNRTSSESSKTLSCMCHRSGVAIDSDNPDARIPLEQLGTVSTEPAGTVHDSRAISESGKGFGNRCDKDG